MTTFTPPLEATPSAQHHSNAAAENAATTSRAIDEMKRALDGRTGTKRILLKAAAGAGKSHALKRMVSEALRKRRCRRVLVTAFANKQIFPLATSLGRSLGRDRVCLFVGNDRYADALAQYGADVTVECSSNAVPDSCHVVLAVTHKLDWTLRALGDSLSPAANGGKPFDVVFVDEAWQLALHRYVIVERSAPLVIGVGDVGQLPPLDPGQNPWRGDRTYNPFRAWPTVYEDDAETWSAELPAVWRPTAEQLGLWRSFYGDWDRLDCVAAPGDRSLTLKRTKSASAPIWKQVATGIPTLVEVEGLDDPDAPDIDPPLLAEVESWLDDLLGGGFEISTTDYDDAGEPAGVSTVRSKKPPAIGDPLIAVLATRNQAVDDAQAMVDRLVEAHDLDENVIVASTVDSWQGQTNAITIAIHPLSGASALDDFNSAFGRLAVTCTRATHGLLLVSRAGLDDLLAVAPPRPGTPLGEPGTRQLPRQTHERILRTFARGRWSA